MSKITRIEKSSMFGRLTVIADEHPTMVLCRCECGVERLFRRTSLRYGTSKSCGCSAWEKFGGHNKQHGESQTPEYRAWSAMKARCERETHPAFRHYGGRGIKVCKSWSENYLNFLRDMGRRPEGATLDRLDNMGHYSPENCRWVSHQKNLQNTRASRRWVIDGKEYASAAEAAKANGVGSATIIGWCKGYKVKGRHYAARSGCSCENVYGESGG